MNLPNNVDTFDPELKFAHSIFNCRGRPSNFLSNNWGNLAKSLPHSTLLTFGEPLASYFASKHLYFVHFTKNFEAIKSSGKLLSSPGNLVDVVYCIPARKNIDNSFSFHNYGNNVFKHLKPTEYNQLHPLIIEIDLSGEKKSSIIGVNYLKLGPIYWKAFNSYLKPPVSLLHQIEKKYNFSMTLLSRLSAWIEPGRQQIRYVESIDDAIKVLDIISEISVEEPLFSFYYLEAVSLCLMYSSTDTETLSLLKKKETNNYLYIKVVHKLTDQPGTIFAAHTFRPKYEKLRQILTKEISDNHLNLDMDNFMITVANILLYYFNSWLTNSEFKDDGRYISLLGQLASLTVYFNQQDYPEFTESVRRKLATIVHNYWNNKHSAIVINSCTPKGEVGINPEYTSLKYRIYDCEFDSSRNNLLLLSKIEVQICPI